MKQSKYQTALYWQHHSEVPGELWANLFRNEPIKPSTVFAHVVIVDCFGESVERWMGFPSVDALTGFLRYAFLPAGFTTWCARDEIGGLVISDTSVEDVIRLFEESEVCKYKDEIPMMWKHAQTLSHIIDLPEAEQLPALRDFAEEFRKQWNQRRDVFFYFEVFSSPNEIGELIVQAYEEEGLLDFFEDQLGVTKDEWQRIVDHVYESEFMTRRFVDILNNKVEFMM